MSSDTIWEFKACSLKFGSGAVEEIGYEAARFKVSKVLVITDPGIRRTGIPDRVVNLINEEGMTCELWAEVEPEPSMESITRCLEWLNGRDFDLYVSIGGGSSMDTAKLVNLLATYGGEILDYVAPPTGKGKSPPGPLKPHIAIPTTAGTGSETSPVAVVSIGNLKVGVSNRLLRPELSIIDPLLHVSMPPKVTADSGIDALSHALESFVTRRFNCKPRPDTPSERPAYTGGNLLTDVHAELAIELIGKHLRRAVYNGRDLHARTGMALASHLAGRAFTNAGLTVLHSMAMSIGALFHVTHGESIAAILPTVMEFFVPAAPEKFTKIATLLDSTALRPSPYDAVKSLVKLLRDVNAPNGLSALGVTEEDVPKIAENSMKLRRLLVGSPRPTSKEDIAELLFNSMTLW